MSARPWMPLYVADYLADTGHLSTLEHGAYMLLIMHYWQNGGLPEDERRIARICRMSPAEWSESRDAIADLFDDCWRHERIDAELARAQDVSSKRRAAAEQRHVKSNANAPAIAEQKHTQSQSHTQQEKEAPIGASKKRASRLPADWQIPDDWLEEAIAAGLSRQSALSEATRMHNWSLSDRNGAKLDWRATWRNWFDRAARTTYARHATAPPPSDRERLNAALDSLISGKDHEPDVPCPRTIDASFERGDRGGAESPVQLVAFPARN